MPWDDDQTLTVAVDADTSALQSALEDADHMAKNFGRSLAGALDGAAVRGRSLTDVLRSVGMRLSDLALKAALQPVEQGISGLVSGLFSQVTPFAKGGVVGAPTFFPTGRGLGLMGEAGQEAVMPLARGPDGRLGVRAAGGAAGPSITVNISTPDVEGFRRSEAQVSAALARAVARGRRAM